MKKILFLFIFLLSAEFMFGQFNFGVKAGYNASVLSSNYDAVKSSFNSGFHVGVFARVGKRLYVQPEVYYALQTSMFSDEGSTWKEKVTIGSMDIPLLLGFKIIKSKPVNLRLMAGPVASFVVNRKIKELGDVTGPLQEADIHNLNWGIQAGAGLDILFLTLDVRYQVGLNNVIKEVQTKAWNSKNNIWVVSLGFKII